MNRKFFGAGVMNILDETRIIFAVSAIKAPWVKCAIDGFKQDMRDIVSHHSVR